MKDRKNVLLAACLALLCTAVDAAAPAAPVAVNIPEQLLQDALNSLARQTGLQVIFQVPDVEGATAPRIEGSYTPQAALGLLLAGTELTFEFLNDRTVAIRATPNKEASARKLTISQVSQGNAVPAAPAPDSSANAGKEGAQESRTYPADNTFGIPEILVTGSKILNMDIQRTRDDPQPYVIFDRKTIETSGAANVNEFLSQRLTMNTSAARMEQTASPLGNLSSINLRGLGATQTLILVDGHRIASASNSTPLQANLNSIPLAAIERIEVLPTTASGIYGGGATGGVVNVIMRRDYSGAELTTSYENSFDADAGALRVDFATGFNLEGDRTNVLLVGSYADSNMLPLSDTKFFQRAQSRILANNPGYYFDNPNPPLGATTNIRSLDGSPLFGPGTANYTSVPSGYAGGGGLAPLQANAGQYNFNSPGTAQNPGGSNTHLLKESRMKAFGATVRRQFSATVDAFVEVAASEGDSSYPTVVGLNSYTLQADAANNPFGQAVRVTVPLVGAGTESSAANNDRRVMGGVIVKLPGRWLAEADYTWSQASMLVQEPSLVFGAIGAIQDVTIDVLRDASAYPFDFGPYRSARGSNGPHRSTLKDATLRFAGPLWDLPAGPLTASVLFEHRDEILAKSRFTGGYFPGKSQTVDSAYLELKVPLLAASSARGAEPTLELQLAGRYDDYAVTGATGYVFDGSDAPVERMTANTSSVNPMLGVRYQPLADLMLRASWGTGFLPPSVSQIFPNPPSTELLTDGVDPLRGNTPAGPYVLLYGGNPALTPEESESFSVGAVLTPRFLDGLRLSLDYSQISKTDNIVALTEQQTIDNESILSGRVVRGERLPGDPAGWAGPIVRLDGSLINISRAEVEAYDAALDYHLDTAYGTFDFYALGTWQTHYKTRVIPTLPQEENVGITSGSPLKFKGNAGVNWQFGPWTLGWAGRYYDSYQVAANVLTSGAVIVANQGGLRVSDQVYHDLFATYRLDMAAGSRARLLDGTQIQLSVKNVLDAMPPFDAGSATASPYYYSAFGDPRGATYYIALKKTFGR